MENRFGVKDFVLFLLLIGLMVMVGMAMWQFDRQYGEIQTLKRQNNELTRDLVNIQRTLNQGVVAIGSGPGATTKPAAADDPFRLIREAEQMPHFARGDWMVDNFSTKIGRLTPLVSSDIYQKWIEYQVMEGLAQRDPYTLDFKPLLATGWEESPDGLRVKFFLRRNVTFSDGEPFTADDVVFTFNWIMNEAVDAARDRAYMTEFQKVEKIDDYTVEFTFKKFYYKNLETIVLTSIMPEHFYGRFKPEQFNEKTGLMMGTGPYKLEDPENWTPTGEPLSIVRNERYWGVPPTFNRLVFHQTQGEAVEMVRYGNQEQDTIRCTPEMYEKLRNDPRVMNFSKAMVVPSLFKGYLYVAWNQLRKTDGKDVKTPFADTRVRRAMTMLLDRQRMTKEIFLGYYTVADGPFGPNNPQSDPGVEPWPHDVKAAKALLAEAGYKDQNGDGVIEGPDGSPLRFTLTYPSGSETWEKAVLFMKDAYARAGITLEPERVDWPVLVQKLTQSNFDAVTLGWSRTPESDPYQIFHSASIADQGDNRTSYRNPELDKAIEQARTTLDKDERMELWHKVHRILHEDQPYTFLFDRPELRLFNDRIQNIQPSPIGLNFELLNGGVIPWYVPEGRQRYTK